MTLDVISPKATSRKNVSCSLAAEGIDRCSKLFRQGSPAYSDVHSDAALSSAGLRSGILKTRESHSERNQPVRFGFAFLG